MDILFSVAKWLLYGFFGLILLLVVFVLVFGKRIRKQWEFEADFQDDSGKAFGECEIELSRIEKQEPDYTLKLKFRMRHPALREHATVEVYVDDTLVMQRQVETEGRMFLAQQPLINPIEQITAGQTCRVVVGESEVAAAEFHPD